MKSLLLRSRVVVCLFAFVCTCLGGQAPEVMTIAGRLRGSEDGGVYSFKGIPYGADTATTRFQAPKPVAPWAGVRPALVFGRRAPQLGEKRGEAGLEQSEDCLNLNVWTQGLGDGIKRPVLVYFHGGAYNNGTVNEALYDGTRLCLRGGVVVVTVNHRLNGFGFLSLAELAGETYADSGNAGMLDLVLALTWVRDNIRTFGGDPGCVTIFGQSGGGAKCATLMAMPSARGLFHRVWTMSGQQLTGRTQAHATQSAREVLSALGIPTERAADIAKVPLERLQSAMRSGTWTPVVDGRILPRDPFAPDASPLSADIPMVLGNTLDETRGLIGGREPGLFSLDWDALPGRLQQAVRPFIGELAPGTIVAKYRILYPSMTPSDIFFAASTAARSWKGMVLEGEARVRQGGAPTYVYHLNWRSPVDGGKWGASHTLDIPLVFDNIVIAAGQTGGGADAQRLADLMSDALIAFARSGNPATPALPAWPRHELGKRPTMLFDLTPRVAEDPRGEERKLFAPIPYVQPGT